MRLREALAALAADEEIQTAVSSANPQTIRRQKTYDLKTIP